VAPAVVAVVERALGVTPEDLTPPMEAYHTLAAEQVRRWGYDKTLDQDEMAKYIRGQAEDVNLRADVETVWRFAAHHFRGAR